MNRFDDKKQKVGYWRSDIEKDSVVDIIVHDLMPSFTLGRHIYSWEGNYDKDTEIGLWKFYDKDGQLIAENLYLV